MEFFRATKFLWLSCCTTSFPKRGAAFKNTMDQVCQAGIDFSGTSAIAKQALADNNRKHRSAVSPRESHCTQSYSKLQRCLVSHCAYCSRCQMPHLFPSSLSLGTSLLLKEPSPRHFSCSFLLSYSVWVFLALSDKSS